MSIIFRKKYELCRFNLCNKNILNNMSGKLGISSDSNKTSGLNPEVWGPHYWFFLHTITLNYPHYPNDVTRKKYYELISNLPLFIPVESIATDFSKLLDEYPVTSYLDSRDEFVRWMHFIHNKINEKLELPKIPIHVFYSTYYEQYKPKVILKQEDNRWKQKLVYTIVLISLVSCVLYLHHYK